MDNSTAPAQLTWFLTPECYDTLLVQGQFANGPCLKLVLSKAIGYLILITMSIFVKMPQLIKILRARSADGVNFTSELMMMVVSSTGVVYNLKRSYPISTWGESVALSLQSFAISIAILVYTERRRLAYVYASLSVLAVSLLLSPMTPFYVHSTLQTLNLPFISISKMLQIRTVWRASSTGKLSAVSVSMQNFRSFGRLFSSIVETGDVHRISMYAIASMLNTILSAQMIYYRYIPSHQRKIKS